MTAAVLASALVIATAGPAEAVSTAGTLDPNFGTGGVVVTDVGGPGGTDHVNSLIALPGGATVAVGQAGAAGGTGDFALVRYLPDGTPDPAFGSGGTVRTDVSGTGSEDLAMAAVAQPDGKLVVSGAVRNGWELRLALARYLPDGGLDHTFGTGGTVVTAGIAAGLGGGWDVTRQPDGKIVVVGTHYGPYDGNRFAVARYLPDGSLDPTFGTGGTVVTPVSSPVPGGSPSVNYDLPRAVTVLADGAILVGGIAGRDYGRHLYGYQFALVRYTPAGVLDPAFGSGGKVITTLGIGVGYLHDLAVRPDGRIVTAGTAGGSAVGGERDIAVVQYDRDGVLDPAFGTGGVTRTDLTGSSGSDYAVDLALDPGGRVLVGGYVSRAPSPNDTAFLLARYDSAGALDPAFGTGGVTVTDVVPAADIEYATAMTVHETGRVVLGGFTNPAGSTWDFTLAAYRR